MKRTTFLCELAGPDYLRCEKAYAHNSGHRMTERLVRELAREVGEALIGDKPIRDKETDTMTRVWRGEKTGRIYTARVFPQL